MVILASKVSYFFFYFSQLRNLISDKGALAIVRFVSNVVTKVGLNMKIIKLVKKNNNTTIM